MKILVLNVGSTSVKYDVYDTAAGERRIAEGEIDHVTDASEVEHAVEAAFAQLGAALPVEAVGHRVVHGGERLVQPVKIDAAIEAAIDACRTFAPLHNPLNLRGIRAARARFPSLPHVAVFDTAFHADLPPHAYLYGLPYALYEQHGIRRYGFHGHSHQYVASRVAEHLAGDHALDPAQLRLVTCHLGGGASVAAIRGGASVDTSMGLTPLEGLVMGTRSGDLDPSIPGILEELGYARAQIATLLNHESGVAGISGLGADFRDLEAHAARGHARARLAIDVYVHRLRKYIGAYAAALGGLDALAFTGGIGEHSARVRAQVCDRLGYMGVALDDARNAQAQVGPDRGVAEVSVPSARARVLVVHTEEERMIAREVARCLRS